MLFLLVVPRSPAPLWLAGVRGGNDWPFPPPNGLRWPLADPPPLSLSYPKVLSIQYLSSSILLCVLVCSFDT